MCFVDALGIVYVEVGSPSFAFAIVAPSASAGLTHNPLRRSTTPVHTVNGIVRTLAVEIVHLPSEVSVHSEFLGDVGLQESIEFELVESGHFASCLLLHSHYAEVFTIDGAAWDEE